MTCTEYLIRQAAREIGITSPLRDNAFKVAASTDDAGRYEVSFTNRQGDTSLVLVTMWEDFKAIHAAFKAGWSGEKKG